MNVDKLTEIAEWLEAGAPERNGVVAFSMSKFIDPRPCGTACCIAGAVVQFETSQPYDDEGDFHLRNEEADTLSDYAADLLGLDWDTKEELFYAMDVQRMFEQEVPEDFDTLTLITPDWAARCIRKLIATGNVDWEGTYEVP